MRVTYLDLDSPTTPVLSLLVGWIIRIFHISSLLPDAGMSESFTFRLGVTYFYISEWVGYFCLRSLRIRDSSDSDSLITKATGLIVRPHSGDLISVLTSCTVHTRSKRTEIRTRRFRERRVRRITWGNQISCFTWRWNECSSWWIKCQKQGVKLSFA